MTETISERVIFMDQSVLIDWYPKAAEKINNEKYFIKHFIIQQEKYKVIYIYDKSKKNIKTIKRINIIIMCSN